MISKAINFVREEYQNLSRYNYKKGEGIFAKKEELK